MEHLKKLGLHLDAQPGDRVFWFTTTGWMMWNFLAGVLLTRAAIVLYDGSPGHPDLGVLWDLAERAGVTCFGTSAAYIASCMKGGVEPGAGRDLSRLQSVGSTGSPLSPEGFEWVYEHVGADTWLFSTSGGTDVCTAFVGGVPTLPVYQGELQARALGAAVEAFDEDGRALTGEVGELVITEPMPSMPLFFWNDPGGERLRESYFSMYPGIWRHGDWIEFSERGTAVIYGRSDSTINRGGIRMGTSEIYRAVLGLDEVVDALVVDVPTPGAESWMPLFVVLREGAELDDELIGSIAARVREECSPRHVPNEVFAIGEVPRTLSGKLLEVPVKRILMGTPAEVAASRDSLQNPAALDPFVAMAASRQALAGAVLQPLGQALHPELTRGLRAAGAVGGCVARALDLHRLQLGDVPEGPQLVRRAGQDVALRAVLLGLLQRGLQRAVATQDVRGALLPDPLCARQAVRRIAAEGDEVGHALRGDPVAALHLGRVDALGPLLAAAAEQQDGHLLRGRLEHVPVAREHQGGPAGLLLDPRQGAHHVVRLQHVRDAHPPPEGPEEVGRQRELVRQVVRNRRPVGVVGGVALHPVCGRVGPEAAHRRAGILLLRDGQDRVHRPQQSVHRPAVGALDRVGEGEEGPVEQVRRVD